MPKNCHFVNAQGAEHYFTSCQDTLYLCHPHHRSSSFHGKKSQWNITRPEECHVFCQAVVLGTSETSGGLWFISQGGKRKVGKNQERLAFFEPQTSAPEPWHGYPVGVQKRGAAHRPPAEVVQAWLESGRIQRHVADKIRRGVL